MDVALDCPACRRPIRVRLAETPTCPSCGATLRPFLPARPDVLERCAGCGEHRLYRQKDLDRRVGVAVIVGSAALSLALLPVSPLLAYAVLFLLALVDLGLYRMLPEVIVCYRCKAQHRGFARGTEVGPFDLLTAEVIDEQERREAGEGRKTVS